MSLKLTHRIPQQWRKAYLAKRRPNQIRKDLVVAFDRIENLKTRIWVLTGTLAAAAGLVGWLASQLFSRLK